jgi:hypothetical protein
MRVTVSSFANTIGLTMIVPSSSSRKTPSGLCWLSWPPPATTISNRSCGGGYVDVELPSEPPRPRERQDSGFIDAVRTERPDLNIDAALADFDQKMAPKDPTATERQRRRREKQRDRDTVTGSVTERDADRDSVTTAPALPEQLELNGGGNTALTH